MGHMPGLVLCSAHVERQGPSISTLDGDASGRAAGAATPCVHSPRDSRSEEAEGKAGSALCRCVGVHAFLVVLPAWMIFKAGNWN